MIADIATGSFNLPLLPTGEDILPLAIFLRDQYRQDHPARAEVPPRTLIVQPAPCAVYGVMPAYCPHHQLFIAKVATLCTGQTHGPAVNALVCVFDGSNGQPLALLEGTQVTNLKCAAVSAMVTDFCAVDDASVLAVFGCGVQAWQQVQAVLAVRPIRQLRLYARNREHLDDFIQRVHQRWPNRLEIVTLANETQTVRNADIVGTATTCAAPLFPPTALSPHAHVNCIGAHTPNGREVPLSLLSQALVVVEDRQTAITEAGDVHARALNFHQLLNHSPAAVKHRQSVFSSTGHGYLDLLTVAFLLHRQRLKAGNGGDVV